MGRGPGGNDERERGKEKKRGENTSRLWPRCLSFISFAARESDRLEDRLLDKGSIQRLPFYYAERTH